MTTIKALIREHPVITYFVLAYLISWGGLLLIAGGPFGIPGTSEQIKKLFATAYGVTGIGPSVAAILLISLIYGRAGFRELLSRLFRWQVEARWYAVALLTVPLLSIAIELVLMLFSAKFLPRILLTEHKLALVLSGVGLGLAAGIFEELGWTGFALPRLRTRNNVLKAGLILGFLWGGWHLLLFIWRSGNASGQLSLSLFLPVLLSALGLLPAYRMLVVWVYDHTQSLLVAIFMHAAVDATSVILSPLPRGVSAYSLILPVLLWILAGAVLLVNRGWRETRVSLTR